MLKHDPSDASSTRDGGQLSRLAPAFAATQLEHRDAIIIAVAGELDIATAPELVRVLREVDPSRPVLVDLAECEFIDSSGQLVLLGHRHRLGGFAVCCTEGDAARQLFELTGVADHRAGHGAPLRVFPSRGEALKALSLAARRDSATHSLRLASTRVAGSRPEDVPLTHHPPAG